jgi:hypothetical protein
METQNTVEGAVVTFRFKEVMRSSASPAPNKSKKTPPPFLIPFMVTILNAVLHTGLDLITNFFKRFSKTLQQGSIHSVVEEEAEEMT